ncbi:MAG: DUF6178 family protein [Myxococcota bacterium]
MDNERGASNVLSLLPWDIAIKGAVQRRDAHAILSREDADSTIRGLSELELYYAVKALGSDESGPYLAVIGRDQIRALVDLDVWKKDRLGLDDLLVWMTAFGELGRARLAEAVLALDPEVVATLLRRRLLISRVVREDTGGTDPDWVLAPPEEIQPLVQTQDTRFWVAARAVDEWDELEGQPRRIDEEERKQVLELVDALFKEAGPEVAGGILRMAETDMSSDLEESAFRFREARLEDLGFPSLARALEVYTPAPLSALGGVVAEPVPSELKLPALHAGRISQGFLRDALRAVDSPEAIRRIEGELVPLANAMLRADGIEPQDLERIKESLDRIRAYLELGVSANTRPEERLEVATARLMKEPLRRLFSVGYGLTLALASEAKKLLQSGAFSLGDRQAALLVDDDRALLSALGQKRPLLTDPGSVSPRPFLNLADLAQVEGRLARIAGAAKVALALKLKEANLALAGVEPKEPAERPIRMLLTTRAAWALLGEAPRLQPIGAALLQRLRGLLLERSFPKDAVDQAIVAAGLSEATLEVQAGLAELAEGLYLVPLGQAIDPRFVGGVIRPGA